MNKHIGVSLVAPLLFVVLLFMGGCSTKPPKPGITISNVAGIVLNEITSDVVYVSLMIEDPQTGIVSIHGTICCQTLEIMRDVPAGSLGRAEGVPKKDILRVHLNRISDIIGGGQGGTSLSHVTVIN